MLFPLVEREWISQARSRTGGHRRGSGCRRRRQAPRGHAAARSHNPSTHRVGYYGGAKEVILKSQVSLLDTRPEDSIRGPKPHHFPSPHSRALIRGQKTGGDIVARGMNRVSSLFGGPCPTNRFLTSAHESNSSAPVLDISACESNILAHDSNILAHQHVLMGHF